MTETETEQRAAPRAWTDVPEDFDQHWAQVGDPPSRAEDGVTLIIAAIGLVLLGVVGVGVYAYITGRHW